MFFSTAGQPAVVHALLPDHQRACTVPAQRVVGRTQHRRAAGRAAGALHDAVAGQVGVATRVLLLSVVGG